MPPRITNSITWQQAELLMQPAFIRVIDNISKELNTSSWAGTYKDILIWQGGTTEETKARVAMLVKELETATPEQSEVIHEALEKLPTPHPGYHLCLQRQDQQISIDLWELCYQICFLDYTPDNDIVDVDTSLIDDRGEVDWQQLENKTRNLVASVFANLPT
jgi:hypothetical protein